MERILKVATMRALEKQVLQGDISYTKMIEIINLKAYEQTCKAIESFKIKQAEVLLEAFGERKPIAYEWHNEETGHAIVDYDTEYRKDLTSNGYTKKPLFY